MILKYLACLNVVFCVFFISSCGWNEDEKSNSLLLNVNPYDAKEEINLSEFVDSVHFIKLETNPNTLIGRIHSLFIKEKYIYVLDLSQQVVWVFDLDGSFLTKLDKQGKGPGEYNSIGGVVVDEDEAYIEIFSRSGSANKVLKYANPSFELLSEKEVPSVSANTIRKRGDYYYFATQQNDNFVNGEPTNAGVLVLNGASIIKTLFDKRIETGGSYYSFNGESFALNDSGDLFVSIMFDNTFYKLEKEDAVPVLTVDFGGHGIDNNTIGLKSTKEQMQYLSTVENAAFLPVLDINNSNILSLSYYFKDGNSHNLNQWIHLKKSDRIFHTRKIKNDVSNYPSYVRLCSDCAGFNHNSWQKDFLVAVINPPMHLIGEENNEVNIKGIGKVEGGDNPVIMLMRLKE